VLETASRLAMIPSRYRASSSFRSNACARRVDIGPAIPRSEDDRRIRGNTLDPIGAAGIGENTQIRTKTPRFTVTERLLTSWVPTEAVAVAQV
jgi:hypothetical protein